MNTTPKSKLLVITVIVLLLTNITVLFFFLTSKPEPRKGGKGDREMMVKNFLQKDIGFSEQQMTLYDSLNKQQKEKMRLRFDEMRNNRQLLYKVLGANGFTDSAISAAAIKVSDNQKDMETNMLMHFAAVRKLCTPAQLIKFDTLFYTIWNKRDDKQRKPD